MTNLIGSGDLVRSLRDSGQRASQRIIDHLLATRPELEPAQRIAGKRLFSPREVRAIKRALSTRRLSTVVR